MTLGEIQDGPLPPVKKKGRAPHPAACRAIDLRVGQWFQVSLEAEAEAARWGGKKAGYVMSVKRALDGGWIVLRRA